MDIFQIILVLFFFVTLVLSYVARKHFPDKVNKIIPYNFVVLGSLFFYAGLDNGNKFVLYSGIGFFVYGIFLLSKRTKIAKENSSSNLTE